MAHKDSHNPPGQSDGQNNGQGQSNIGRSTAAEASMNAALALSKSNSAKGGHISNITCMFCHEEGTHDAPLIKVGGNEYFHAEHIDSFNNLNDAVFE